VFLFPWALVVRQLGAWGILAMLMFLSILLLGWVYAYRERILEWK
jgi:NADH-quinone oxidoreductase subunit A